MPLEMEKGVKTLRFCSATAGYRILRLSIELFIVEHTLASDYSVAVAGTLFLVYSLCDILVGLSFLWFPSMFLGSHRRGLAFFFLTVGSLVGGYLVFFLSTNIAIMAVSIGLCGCGTAGWYINYQSLTNLAFEKHNLKKVAQLRQGFEAIGFLIPSVCLAIVNSTVEEKERGGSIRVSAIALGLAGLIFFCIASTEVIAAAATAKPTQSEVSTEEMTDSVWKSTKDFFASSVFHCFWTNAILLAMNNVLGGSMSLITEEYFGLKPTFLWLAAIGIPLGGMLSVGIALLVGKMKDKKRFLVSSFCIELVFVILVSTSSSAISFWEDHSIGAKIGLFSLGFTVGYFYSEAWTVAFTYWLEELKKYPQAFIARANSFHNTGVQVVLACVFQIQTLALAAVIEEEDNPNPVSVASVLFVPFIILMGICIILVLSKPPLFNLAKFEWPFAFPWQMKLAIRFIVATMGASEESLLFGKFCDFRSCAFGKHLYEAEVNDGGVSTNRFSLSHQGLKSYLEEFCKANSYRTKDDWFVSEGNLQKVLFDNEESLNARYDLIDSALSSIWLMTWSLDGDLSLEVALKLIEKHRAGVQVRIIVDGVNLYYLALSSNMSNEIKTSLSTLKMLSDAGVEVRLLEDWHNDQEYVTGTHRKILLVDGDWLLTGGRNTADPYLTNKGFTFNDLDIVILGNFEMSTKKMLQSFWTKSKEISVLEDCPSPPAKTRTDTSEPASIVSNSAENRISSSPLDAWNIGDVIGVAPSIPDHHPTSNRPSFALFGGELPVQTPSRLSSRRSSISSPTRSNMNARHSLPLHALTDMTLGNATDTRRVSTNTPVASTNTFRASYHRESLWANDDHEVNVERRGSLLGLLELQKHRKDDAPKSKPPLPTLISTNMSANMDNGVEIIELNHLAGSIHGVDIIYSSLLFLIETAKISVDLVFGYFQLFPQLERALENAQKRGVKIRILTNSEETNDLYFFAKVFADSFSRLLEMGIKVYVMDAAFFPESDPCCAHYKFATADDRVAMVGSWNCLGTSIFHDSEYGVVMFGSEEGTTVCDPFKKHIASLLGTGAYVRLKSSPLPDDIPSFYCLFLSQEALNQAERGY